MDHAIELLVTAWRQATRGYPQAILVTSDHGQSFYEDGLLGHAQSLGIAQARVPFIVWGIGGEWPEPIAPSDLRGLLDRNLFAARGTLPVPHFVPDPSRRVFQYLGELEEPQRMGFRSLDGLLEFDGGSGRATWSASDAEEHREVAAPDPTLELVHAWESLVLSEDGEAFPSEAASASGS